MQTTNYREFKLTTQNISSGLITGTLALTGPLAVVLTAAEAGYFTPEQTISWVFASYFFGGIFSVLVPFILKIPVTGAHTISGAAFLATVAHQFSHAEMIGFYIMSALILFMIGISGLFSKLMQWFPKEIISAMLAGIITTYVVNLVVSVHALPLVGIPALFTYFILIKWVKRIPSVIGAVVVAFIALFLTQDLHLLNMDSNYLFPTIYKPEFTLLGFFTVAIPLALLILSNDAAPGIGALEQYDFKPPSSKIITYSGLASFCAALFGGQSANIGGMMTAISADPTSGAKQYRYIASIISGFILITFSLLAWKFVPYIQALPAAFVMMLAGLSLIGVLVSSLTMSFANEQYKLGPLFAFIIALSNVSFLHISAPVWALIIGSLIAKCIEKEKATN